MISVTTIVRTCGFTHIYTHTHTHTSTQTHTEGSQSTKDRGSLFSHTWGKSLECRLWFDCPMFDQISNKGLVSFSVNKIALILDCIVNYEVRIEVNLVHILGCVRFSNSMTVYILCKFRGLITFRKKNTKFWRFISISYWLEAVNKMVMIDGSVKYCTALR
jgi:hypothetical protein